MTAQVNERLDMDGKPVIIKYDTIYTPNQSVYPGLKFKSYIEMKAACPRLWEVQDEMFEKGIPFTPYTTESQLKPEFTPPPQEDDE